MKSWEVDRRGVSFDGETICVWDEQGSPMSWVGSSCGIEEFLEGRFHSLIVSHVGQEALDELLRLVEEPDEDLRRQERERQELAQAWRAIPAREPLDYLSLDWLEPFCQGQPEPGQRFDLGAGFAWIHGADNVVPESYRLDPDALSATYREGLEEMEFDKLELPDGRVILAPHYLKGHALYHDEHLYVTAGDDLHVFNLAGEIVFTSRSMRQSHKLGTAVRLSQLILFEGEVWVSYWHMGGSETHTLLAAELGGGGILVVGPQGILARAKGIDAM